MTQGRNLADILNTVVKNDANTLTNHVLGLTGSQEHVTGSESTDTQVMMHLIKVGLAPVKVVGGLAMLAGGAIVAVIPKKKVEITTNGVTALPVADPEHIGNDQYEIVSVRFTDTYASGVSGVRQTTASETFPDGEPILNIANDGDTTKLPLPQLPTTTAPVIDYSNRHKPVSTSTTSTSVSGARIAAAGVSEVLEGTYEALAGISALAIEGGRKLYGFYKTKTATQTQAQPNQQQTAGPSNK